MRASTQPVAIFVESSRRGTCAIIVRASRRSGCVIVVRASASRRGVCATLCPGRRRSDCAIVVQASGRGDRAIFVQADGVAAARSLSRRAGAATARSLPGIAGEASRDRCQPGTLARSSLWLAAGDLAVRRAHRSGSTARLGPGKWAQKNPPEFPRAGLKKNPAATYSPTEVTLQYHRPWRA